MICTPQFVTLSGFASWLLFICWSEINFLLESQSDNWIAALRMQTDWLSLFKISLARSISYLLTLIQGRNLSQPARRRWLDFSMFLLKLDVLCLCGRVVGMIKWLLVVNFNLASLEMSRHLLLKVPARFQTQLCVWWELKIDYARITIAGFICLLSHQPHSIFMFEILLVKWLLYFMSSIIFKSKVSVSSNTGFHVDKNTNDCFMATRRQEKTFVKRAPTAFTWVKYIFLSVWPLFQVKEHGWLACSYILVSFWAAILKIGHCEWRTIVWETTWN